MDVRAEIPPEGSAAAATAAAAGVLHITAATAGVLHIATAAVTGVAALYGAAAVVLRAAAATAGTHCCALCDDSGTYYSCIDISRHNCMDKLAGKALLSDISLRDKYILTSGRIPMDMIQKVAAIGAPMIVSRSTPTIAAVETARKANITLLGFSRENRFNIYSAAQRLKGCGFSVPAADPAE